MGIALVGRLHVVITAMCNHHYLTALLYNSLGTLFVKEIDAVMSY